MSVSRSRAYWAANRYQDEAQEPAPTAPLHDLPSSAAGRFAALRAGLLALDGVAETVRYMGATWRWAWEYGVGNRKLCWAHVVGNGVSVTFTLSDAEEDRLRRLPRAPADVQRAVREGQRTGPLVWCWLPLDDRRAVDTFLRFAARKVEWLNDRPTGHRAPQLRRRRASTRDSDDTG